MKKTILIFCSWLDLEIGTGIFFREQAEIVSIDYLPILVLFNKRYLTKKNFFQKHFFIEKSYTNEGLLFIQVNYPNYYRLPYIINSLFENIAISILNNYIKKNKVNISFIHAQSLFDAGIQAYKYSNKYKVPYIITEHKQLSFINIDKNKCNFIKKSLENSKYNLVVSNDKIRQFASNNLFYNFINIGNLISNKFFFEENCDKSDKIKLITVGAYSKIKDQDTIIKALKIVDSKIITKIDFIWIGFDGWGGDNYIKVKAIIDEQNFKNIDFILLPKLGRNEIATYLKISNLFLFSSLSEGMPVSVLEALACGLPVFTSNCGGVDEIINESNGKIFQIKDHNNLAKLILSFFDSNLIYNKKQISEEIISLYGEIAFRNKLLTIYNSIV